MFPPVKTYVNFSIKSLNSLSHNLFMNLPSPLKSGLGGFISAAILFVYWLIFPNATTALVMAIVAVVWGILWTNLQHRANLNTQKEMEAPAYVQPVKGKMVALSRVKQGFKQGWLVTDHEQLFFYEGQLETSPGKTFNPGSEGLILISPIEKIERFKHSAGLWGGGTLELFPETGKPLKFHLKDPEGLVLLMDMLLEDEDELELDATRG
jgi:hypothetical protein